MYKSKSNLRFKIALICAELTEMFCRFSNHCSTSRLSNQARFFFDMSKYVDRYLEFCFYLGSDSLGAIDLQKYSCPCKQRFVYNLKPLDTLSFVVLQSSNVRALEVAVLMPWSNCLGTPVSQKAQQLLILNGTDAVTVIRYLVLPRQNIFLFVCFW